MDEFGKKFHPNDIDVIYRMARSIFDKAEQETNIEIQKKYYYNDSLHTFISRTSGKKYILGQKLIIKILSINFFKSKLILSIPRLIL